MRPIVAALALLGSALAQEKKNEAEELFTRMEDALSKARTLQLRYDAKMEGPDQAKAEGALLLAEGNKVRMKFDGMLGPKPGVMEVISDGAKTVTVTDGKASPASDTKKTMGEVFRAALARSGFVVTLLTSAPPAPDGKEPDPKSMLKATDFKLGKKEKIGDGEAQAIEFKLEIAGLGPAATSTLWIDVKTSLPRKRVIELSAGGQTATITETYSGVKVDEEIDEARFTLP